MPDAKSGRVHILHQLAVSGGVAVQDTGNHFLLRLTRRSQRCRSGSEISRAGLYQRQGAKGRCRSVEGGWLLNDLKGVALEAQLSSLREPETAVPPKRSLEDMVAEIMDTSRAAAKTGQELQGQVANVQ
jgi:hypothetical protein